MVRFIMPGKNELVLTTLLGVAGALCWLQRKSTAGGAGLSLLRAINIKAATA